MNDELKVKIICSHDNLLACDKYVGIVVNVFDPGSSQVEGMFTFKKYRCADCSKIITVLNAVVEKTAEKRKLVFELKPKLCDNMFGKECPFAYKTQGE